MTPFHEVHANVKKLLILVARLTNTGVCLNGYTPLFRWLPRSSNLTPCDCFGVSSKTHLRLSRASKPGRLKTMLTEEVRSVTHKL